MNRYYRLPVPHAAPRRLVWPALLAGLVAAALLFSFCWVVHETVRQGELRRQAVAWRALATWRCGALSAARLRADCLWQLDAGTPDGSTLPGPQTTQSATLAWVDPPGR